MRFCCELLVSVRQRETGHSLALRKIAGLGPECALHSQGLSLVATDEIPPQASSRQARGRRTGRQAGTEEMLRGRCVFVVCCLFQ